MPVPVAMTVILLDRVTPAHIPVPVFSIAGLAGPHDELYWERPSMQPVVMISIHLPPPPYIQAVRTVASNTGEHPCCDIFTPLQQSRRTNRVDETTITHQFAAWASVD